MDISLAHGTYAASSSVVDGDYATCKQVRSGVHQCTVLGPLMMVLLYINDIGDHLNHFTIRLFDDDCLLYKTIANQIRC